MISIKSLFKYDSGTFCDCAAVLNQQTVQYSDMSYTIIVDELGYHAVEGRLLVSKWDSQHRCLASLLYLHIKQVTPHVTTNCPL